MRYNSSRGQINDFTFEEALFSGFTSDGGMLMPDEIPKVTSDQIRHWSKLSYTELVKEVVALFVPEEEVPREDQSSLIDKAFSRFTHPDVVNIAKLKNGLNILELFHGTTLAFKDLAMSCVGQFFNYFLKKKERHMVVLVGTSGDTGSAAIEAMRGLEAVDIVVMLPKGRCTRIQELQMTTVIEDNVHVYRVDGTSDEIDEPLKNCFTDAAFAQENNLCSVNSINWCRIMVQIAHYFYAYFQLCPGCDDTVEIAVPTGGCGNITAGCLAWFMGLPIEITVTVNRNDIMYHICTEGKLKMPSTMTPSLAPAMDIQNPYNMQRILYMLSNSNGKLVKEIMETFEAGREAVIPDDVFKKMKKIVTKSFVADDDLIKSAMARCWKENQYLLCPHTAVAAAYHYNTLVNSDVIPKRVCIATASPAKFPEAVTLAGLTPQPTPEIAALETKPTRYIDMNKGEDWTGILKEKIKEISQKRRSY
ncbi:threonine synthase-like 2 isoform X2 [Lingula anatina]|nr:threonine synthase-like 2 isoform X2 [Lingula anatina]XP_013420136.1 threonine synthase-like 2 isoform X2 [Lingula anatina]XP_013420137.1 threonine synthase-like 2 isoform X2 [Lingula anatina]XP_013420138.1 threonine synthase-like 2 isoform X2 [Lingula anatina]|eukprot:XP_013420134.1 threonine synthase-like 2 isoform X2 [Lingula anatina]